MPRSYGITVTMDENTVAQLQRDRCVLYAFKAVRGAADGRPLVWCRREDFSLPMKVSWSETYTAYTSTDTRIIPGTQILASASYDIEPGQTLMVMNHEGTGQVILGSDPRAITISNQTTAQFVCGISHPISEGIQPFCAFPLPGNGEVLITPIEKVFLMFATEPLDTGTVVEQSFSQGVLVDLTVDREQTVEYVIDRGWTPKPGAEVVPPDTNLVSLLITSGEQNG
jgi:hypothetical protein